VRAILGLVVSVSVPVLAGAQARGIGLTAEGSVFFANEGLRESQNYGQGALGGAQIRAESGRLSLTVSELLGNVSADPTGSEQHSLRVSRISLLLSPAGWLSTGIQIEAQRSKQQDTVVVWRLFGLAAGLRGGLGIPGLTARLDGVWYPARDSKSSQFYSPPLKSANAWEVGLGYAPKRARVSVRLAYRVEVYRLSNVPSISRGGLLMGIGMKLTGDSRNQFAR
jgi:hypothetical protein